MQELTLRGIGTPGSAVAAAAAGSRCPLFLSHAFHLPPPASGTPRLVPAPLLVPAPVLTILTLGGNLEGSNSPSCCRSQCPWAMAYGCAYDFIHTDRKSDIHTYIHIYMHAAASPSMTSHSSQEAASSTDRTAVRTAVRQPELPSCWTAMRAAGPPGRRAASRGWQRHCIPFWRLCCAVLRYVSMLCSRSASSEACWEQ